jgi:hypothetical protein
MPKCCRNGYLIFQIWNNFTPGSSLPAYSPCAVLLPIQYTLRPYVLHPHVRCTVSVGSTLVGGCVYPVNFLAVAIIGDVFYGAKWKFGFSYSDSVGLSGYGHPVYAGYHCTVYDTISSISHFLSIADVHQRSLNELKVSLQILIKYILKDFGYLRIP